MRPSSLVVRTYVARGVRLWGATRLLVSAALLFGELDPIRLTLGGVIQVILFSIAVCLLDTYRHHERVWLANLGVRPIVLCLLFAVPAALGELAIRLVGGLL